MAQKNGRVGVLGRKRLPAKKTLAVLRNTFQQYVLMSHFFSIPYDTPAIGGFSSSLELPVLEITSEELTVLHTNM